MHKAGTEVTDKNKHFPLKRAHYEAKIEAYGAFPAL